MSAKIPMRHILKQGRVIAALGETALSAAWQGLRPGKKKHPDDLARSLFAGRLPPRDPVLLRDYLEYIGADVEAYRGLVPPHLFAQWAMPYLSRTLRGLSYPMLRILNAGCRLELAAPLPAACAMRVSAQLEQVEDNGQRAIIHMRAVTGTDEAPEAVVARVSAIVPLRSRGKDEGEGRSKTKPEFLVPGDAKVAARWELGPRDGLNFSLLTGDFNPVHWSRLYAKAFGFRNNILHGYNAMGRTMEFLHREVFGGNIHALRVFEAKFTRPLPLPATVTLFLKGQQVYVGDAVGERAYLVGSFEPRS